MESSEPPTQPDLILSIDDEPVTKHTIVHDTVETKKRKRRELVDAIKRENGQCLNALVDNDSPFTFNEPLFNAHCQEYPIHLAATLARSGVLVALVVQGLVDPMVVDKFNRNALHYAMRSVSVECATFLYKYPKMLEVKDVHGDSPLDLLIPPLMYGVLQDVDISQLEGASEKIVLSKVEESILVILKRFQDGWVHMKEKNMAIALSLVEAFWSDSDRNPDKDREVCMVCLDKIADTMVLPCEHNVVCRTCSLELKKTNNAAKCIKCRRAIEHVLE